MREAAKALTKDGVAGFCMGPDWARFAPSSFNHGANFTNEDYTESMLDDPANVQAAQFWADMRFQDQSLFAPSDIGASWCGEAIGKKLAAMTWEGGWMISFLGKDYADVDYKIVPLPAGPQGVSDVLFTNGIGVNAKSQFPRAAAALAIYMSSRENQEAILQTGFALPVIADLLDHEWFNDHPNEAALAEMGKVGKLAYWGPYTGKVQTAVTQSLERVWLQEQEVEPSLQKGSEEVGTALGGG
jgi:multiple sugar transport system substrate-binding protein